MTRAESKKPEWSAKFRFWEVEERERMNMALNIVKAQYGLESDTEALMKLCDGAIARAEKRAEKAAKVVIDKAAA